MRRVGGICGVTALLAGAFLLGFLTTRSADRPAAPHDPGPRQARPKADLAAEVRFELETGYYRLVPESVLAEPSVARMLGGLADPYTEYLSPEEFGELESSASGHYTGVGLTVGEARDGLVVTSAHPGPARAAGIRPGDVIISIDGERAAGMRFERSLVRIAGEEGTTVRLTVKRPNRGKLRFTLVRQELPAPTSRAKMVRVGGTKLGYIRIYSFAERSSEDLHAAAARLSARGAQGLVLDLRDNPGGLLLEAVQSVSLFLEEGVVCTTDGVHQERRVFEVSGATPFPTLPLTVLVNRGSASASEIVAAGLAENGRATVVGQRTYGKAAVQSLRELSNGAALKLTTATYRTPRGHDLFGRGVRPAVRALDDPATRRDEAVVAAGRALLPRA